MKNARHSVPPALRSLGPARRVPPVDHPVAALGQFWYPKPPVWPPMMSVAVHVVTAVALVWTIGDLLERPQAARDSVFFLPPLKQAAPATSGGGGLGGKGSGESVTFTYLPDPGSIHATLGQGGMAAGRGGHRSTGTRDTPVTHLVSDTAAKPGDAIYTSYEVDNAVQFSSRSAVPEYPLDLLARGVQGEVTVRFVVDTTGTADVHSLEIINSSDPQFTASVRQALPRMRFSPARLNGKRVRQLVEQPFRFNIDLSTMTPSDSAAE